MRRAAQRRPMGSAVPQPRPVPTEQVTALHQELTALRKLLQAQHARAANQDALVARLQARLDVVVHYYGPPSYPRS